MSQVLYRKYRPQNFSEVVGQDHVKTVLKNALKTGRVSHAYLFTGPRGVGKTTIARILAKTVNCSSQKDGESCETCENCQLISQNTFLDIVEIDAASYTGVDNIREIIEHVKFAPTSGSYKVFIVDEVHMLSRAAFNALLKTLEEPPAHAIFILATTEAHKVPATISSRTQRFDFRSSTVAEVTELFERILKGENIKVAPEVLRLVSVSAHGSMRDALSILDQLLSFADGEVTLDLAEDLLGISRTEHHHKLLELLHEGNQKEAAEMVRKMAFEGVDLVEFTRGLLEYLRLVLLLKMDAQEKDSLGLAEDDLKSLTHLAEKMSSKHLYNIVKEIMKTYREIKLIPVAELPLLTTVLSLTKDGAPEVTESRPKRSTAPARAEVKPEEKETPKQPESSASHQATVANLDLGKIVDRWADVLSKVKEYNHSLIASLRLGRLVETSGDELVMAFPYNFHKETIEARKNRIVIEQVMEDVFGTKLRLKTTLERDLKTEEASEDSADTSKDLLGEAMRVLGSST